MKRILGYIWELFVLCVLVMLLFNGEITRFITLGVMVCVVTAFSILREVKDSRTSTSVTVTAVINDELDVDKVSEEIARVIKKHSSETT